MKQYLSIAFFTCFLYANVFAQPTVKTEKAAGGSSSERLQSMWLTKDGGLIVGGFSQSNASGEKTGNNRGLLITNDYWIVKFDKPGNIEWDKTIGGSGDDFLYSVQQTSDGGYILGGSSSSGISGEKSEKNLGVTDYWIVKLDSSGNIQWDKTIGGKSSDDLYTVQQTNDGGYILGGISASKASRDKTENSKGGGDYWIVKLNGNGQIEWDKTIGSIAGDAFTALQQTSDGGYILGGWSDGIISGDKTEGSRGSADYWVVKIDNLGQIQWDETIGGSSFDQLNCLQQTSDGGYMLGGVSSSNISGNKTEDSRGNNDYWIVKLDATGHIQWDKTFGGSDMDMLNALQQTKDSGYILGGYSFSNASGEKTENDKGGGDYWVLKLNNSGKIQWDKVIGGNQYDVLRSIKEADKNRYVLGGYSYSGISGDKTQALRGGEDYWVVALINKTGSASITDLSADELTYTKQDNSRNKFIIYPNPANSNITITYTASKKEQYIFEIADLSGRILLHKNINAAEGINHTTFDVSRFAKGMYFINIISPNEEKHISKFIKQ